MAYRIQNDLNYGNKQELRDSIKEMIETLDSLVKRENEMVKP